MITSERERSGLKIRYLLERGRVLNSSRHRDRARPLFMEVWQMGLATGEDFYAVDAAHMLGIVEPPEAQLTWNVKALELAEASPDPRARNWRGSLCNNIGWTYHDAGQYDRALEMFEKALIFRVEQKNELSIRIARWCIARCLRSLGRVDEALAMQKALEVEAEDGYVYEEIGECLLSLGRALEAEPYFAKAHRALSTDAWLAEREPARLERLKQLGKVA